jgi:RNA polymerase sigma-70 factor (ECF subfamily)
MAAALSMPAQSTGRAEVQTPTDELLAAARDGDHAALERVLAMIERRVYTLALRLTCEPAAAEDLSQDAMLKICRHIGRYRVGSNFWGWVYRIVVNQAHDIRRAAKPTVPELEDHPVPPNHDPVRNDQLRRVMQALKILTEKERDALVLTDIEGYTSKEAARILGCLPMAVRTRASAARKKVRERLSRFYPELREAV